MDKLLNKLFLWGFESEMCVRHAVVTPFDTKRMKIILSEGSKIYDLLAAPHTGPRVCELAQIGMGNWSTSDALEPKKHQYESA